MKYTDVLSVGLSVIVAALTAAGSSSGDGVWKIAHRLTVLEWKGVLAGPVAQSGMPPVSMCIEGTWDRSDPSYCRPLVLDRPFRNVCEDGQ